MARLKVLTALFGRNPTIGKDDPPIMRKLWNDLLNEPVLIFTVAGTGMTAINPSIDSAIFDIATVFVVAVGGAITRHYTRSKRSLGE